MKTRQDKSKKSAKVPAVNCAFSRMVAIGDVKPNPRNPNRHPTAQVKLLAKIIAHHGWRNPITVSKRSGLVVRGHGRLEAAKLLGLKSVPVDFQDYATDADETADLVADNRIAELAEIDQGALAELLKCLETNLDLELAGFTAQSANLLLNADEMVESKLIKEKSDKLTLKWATKRGQIWHLGDHVLGIGDALNPENWKRLGGPFGFCFADPPYELAMSITSLRGATRDHLVFMSTDSVLIGQPTNGFRGFFCFTYDNASNFMWTTRPLRQHTLLGWWRFSTSKLNLKGLGTHFHNKGTNHESESRHPQEKGLAMIRDFLKYFTAKGDQIADAFSGSGSTLMAAHSLKRKARSLELDPGYAAVILERFQSTTQIEPVLGKDTVE